MIGYFPRCHPDELLYSVCARFGERLRYPSKKAVSEELFNSVSATAVTDLPTRLDSLARRFPPRSSFTADRLIDERTVLPFFSPFLPPERVRLLRANMKSSGGASVHMRSGVMAGGIPQPGWLRFCPACVEEDRNRFGKTYWHRLHHLPGVEVCPTHAVFLEKSEARARHNKNPFVYLTAEKYARASTPRPLDQSDPTHSILLKLAADAAWLLRQTNLTSSLVVLRNRYVGLLIKCGLASYSGVLRAGQLLRRFKEHYPAPLLRLLRCELDGSGQEKYNWLLHLVRVLNHAHHPLRHLLLINFFEISAEEFFTLPEEIRFFGDAPWPCLNPAAGHYREARVTDYHVSFRGPGHKPVATFYCDCGFSYARTGPDSSQDDRFRISRMKSFGPVWERELTRLWADPTNSVSEISRRLGVDPLTARRHAARLRLPFDRKGREPLTSLDSSLLLKSGDRSAERQNKCREYRRLWLAAAHDDRSRDLKSLRAELPRVYTWLLKNDADWLETHRPVRARPMPENSSVDWERRDAKLAIAVRTRAAELLNAPGRPAFLSKTAISNGLGITSLLRQRIQKLPLTAKALADVSESRVEYAVRRVWWAADCYFRESACPRKWHIIVRANVYRWITYPAVSQALDSAEKLFEKVQPNTSLPLTGSYDVC